MKPLIKILLAAAFVLPLLASPAQAARGMEVAIQDDGVFIFDEHYNREVALATARNFGATHIRMNILWWQAVPSHQRTQTGVPSPIQYNFSVWDQAIARAAAYGIKVQLDLTGDPPAYACGNKQPPYACDGFRPNLTLFKHFAASAAAHFKGRVSRYSIWNEPNWYTWLSPHDEAPLLYRQLVQAGYDAIKLVDPGAEVVMGELAPQFQPNISTPPLQFIREMVCVNKRLKRVRGADENCPGELKFDAFATHPYDFTDRPTKKPSNRDEMSVSNIGALPRLLNKLRKKGLITPSKKRFPIYLTEHGYFVAGRRGVPEARRARWIVKAWDMVQEVPRIKQMLHYVFISPPADSPSAYFDMGLIAQNGTPRTTFFALRNWIQDAASRGEVARAG